VGFGVDGEAERSGECSGLAREDFAGLARVAERESSSAAIGVSASRHFGMPTTRVLRKPSGLVIPGNWPEVRTCVLRGPVDGRFLV
jgi:hypothetical protein